MKSTRLALSLLLATSLAACGDNLPAPGGGDDGPGPDAPPANTPAYALAVIVFGPDPSSDMTYVSVFDSLDITEVDLQHSFPFPGDADIATYAGKLYVASGENPTIERFALGDDGKLKSEGILSFANLGIDNAALRDNVFVSATKAYLPLPDGGFEVWDPSAMTLVKTIAVPDLDRTDMIIDGSIPVLRGNRIYRTYYWEDWSTYTFSTEQYVATFDTDSDTFVGKVAEQHCPNLGAAAQIDETGTIYFSNWYYNVPGTLMSGAPKSCAVRIPANSDAVDPSWSLVFSDVDGGHEGAQLSYIADGKAVFAAFHQEDFAITGDTAPYEIPSAVQWSAYGVDLATKTATPIAGIDRAVADQTVFTLDGRTFLLAPGADWASTQAYEILADGTARKAFPIGGWSRGFFKLK